MAAIPSMRSLLRNRFRILLANQRLRKRSVKGLSAINYHLAIVIGIQLSRAQLHSVGFSFGILVSSLYDKYIVQTKSLSSQRTSEQFIILFQTRHFMLFRTLGTKSQHIFTARCGR